MECSMRCLNKDNILTKEDKDRLKKEKEQLLKHALQKEEIPLVWQDKQKNKKKKKIKQEYKLIKRRETI